MEDSGTGWTLAPGWILSEELHSTFMRWTVETEGRSLFVVGDSWFSGVLVRQGRWPRNRCQGRERNLARRCYRRQGQACRRDAVLAQKPYVRTAIHVGRTACHGWLLWLSRRETPFVPLGPQLANATARTSPPRIDGAAKHPIAAVFPWGDMAACPFVNPAWRRGTLCRKDSSPL